MESIEIEEDIILDDMSQSLSRLHDTSKVIQIDLVKQKQQLQTIEEEIETSQTTIQIIQTKLKHIFQSSDKGRLWCVIILIVLSLLLLFLIIYV